MSEARQDPKDDDMFKALEPIAGTRVAPAHGIAAIALNMAMKYCDINTVQDGTLYQQYKLEGRNLTPLHLDMVFETAIRIEIHLLAASDRIAKIVVDAIAFSIEDDPVPKSPDETEPPGETDR